MRRMLVMGLGAMLAVFAVGARGQEEAKASDTDAVGKLAAANDLDLKGKTPFHLAMTFQLFDMDGKPTETGSFEEWWAAPGSSRVVVRAAGLKEDGSAPDGAALALRRDAYLVHALMEAAVHPVVVSQKAGETLKVETQKFGKTSLSCLTITPTSTPGVTGRPEALCTDPQMEDVRAALGTDGNQALLRNSVGKFHETYVALGLQFSLLGRSAITGKVATLQSFDPKTSEVKLPPPANTDVASSGGVGQIRAGVMAGKRLSFVQPEYPGIAKLEHLSGTVVLGAVIGKDGTVQALTPIASTDGMFTEAAMKAVKQWKYSPYLLNGTSTEVDTTITVNFALFQG